MEKPNTSKLISVTLKLSIFKHFVCCCHKNRIEESEADKNERLAKWQTFLENEDAKREIAEAEAEKNQQGSSETVALEKAEESEIDSEM